MKRNLSTFAGILALMPILYVLSIGPVYGFYAIPATDPKTVQKFFNFYAPVVWLCEKSPRVAYAVTWYANLWVRPPKP